MPRRAGEDFWCKSPFKRSIKKLIDALGCSSQQRVVVFFVVWGGVGAAQNVGEEFKAGVKYLIFIPSRIIFYSLMSRQSDL